LKGKKNPQSSKKNHQMTANVIVTALGHFLGQLSQKQN
jgi:hypothetical protein